MLPECPSVRQLIEHQGHTILQQLLDGSAALTQACTRMQHAKHAASSIQHSMALLAAPKLPSQQLHPHTWMQRVMKLLPAPLHSELCALC